MARKRLGISDADHETDAMRHYNSAEHMADRARKVAGESCKRAFEFYRSAAMQFGQGLAHERSGGGGFEVSARKENAGYALSDAERAVRACLRK